VPAAVGGAGPGALRFAHLGDARNPMKWLGAGHLPCAPPPPTCWMDTLARRWRQVTTIGTLLDPIADKTAGLRRRSSPWCRCACFRPTLAILIIGPRVRRLSGLRSIAAAEGYTIKASDLGKTKMLSQVVAISCMLIGVGRQFLPHPGHGPDVDRGGFSRCSRRSAISSSFWRKVGPSASKLRRRRELWAPWSVKRQRAERRPHGFERPRETWAPRSRIRLK